MLAVRRKENSRPLSKSLSTLTKDAVYINLVLAISTSVFPVKVCTHNAFPGSKFSQAVTPSSSATLSRLQSSCQGPGRVFSCTRSTTPPERYRQTEPEWLRVLLRLLVDRIILPAVELLLDLVGVALDRAVDVHVRWTVESLVVPLHQDARDLLQLFYVLVDLGFLVHYWVRSFFSVRGAGGGGGLGFLARSSGLVLVKLMKTLGLRIRWKRGRKGLAVSAAAAACAVYSCVSVSLVLLYLFSVS